MPHQCTNCGRVFPDGSKEMLSGCPDCGGNKFQFAPKAMAARESADTGDSGSTRARSTASSRTTESADVTDSGAGSEGAGGTRTASESRTAGEKNSDWPSSASPDAGDASTPATGSDEFTEWPDAARRPEDRSAPPQEERADTGTDSPVDSADPTDRSDPVDPSDRTSLPDDEDTAQADARSEVVSTDDLPSQPPDELPPRTRDTDDRAATGSTDVPPESRPADDAAPPGNGRVVSEPSADRPSIEELRAELNQQFESIKILQPGQYELNLMELYNREEYIVSLQEDGRYVIDVPESWRGADSE
ncbi:OapC/ArvC family zinc-ribbon domain-containing protein [Halosolutus gelatinilyticus]|uniref:OapC/ArvC family zinc-ribbon domain-containing protein n=1 Tax=Halosolutus gelatinilyticus TaxID=2931975 RepID=UPI001FF4EA4B|nr:Zn-ribbon containing protein [Halosolutus gelatinilyticus]